VTLASAAAAARAMASLRRDMVENPIFSRSDHRPVGGPAASGVG
jgi:hypothetical protein